MMLRPLTIAAAGLSAASAFLLPPEIRTGFPHGLSILEEANRTLFVDCPGCPVLVQEGSGEAHLINGVNSHLELNFRIDNSGKQPRLLANEFELFPHPNPMRNDLTAKHVPEASEDGSAAPPVESAIPIRLGASLEWHRVPSHKQNPMSHIVVDLQILELSSGFQENIPNVHVDLVHCPMSGRLRIAGIRQTESQAGKHVPLAKQLAECGESMMCKVRAIMMDKMNKLSGHMGKGAHKGGCKMHQGNHQMGGMGGHHDHHGHHGHHMKSSHAQKPHFKLREHSWSQLWNKFVHHILFPVGVGIVAGVSVSLVGMAIGTLIVGLWRVFVRRQSFFPRRRHTHRRSSKSAGSSAEKAALMANVEEASVYQDEEPRTDN